MPSKTQNELEFLAAVNSTTMLVKQLLEDIREGDVTFAIIKTELSSVLIKVQELSLLFRDSEEELAECKTKIALLERDVLELKNWKDQQKNQNNSVLAANTQGKWQVITAIATGGLALIASLITLIISLVK